MMPRHFVEILGNKRPVAKIQYARRMKILVSSVFIEPVLILPNTHVITCKGLFLYIIYLQDSFSEVSQYFCKHII